MSDFQWTERFTQLAIANMEHASWAITNPPDLLFVLREIGRSGGTVTDQQFETIRAQVKTTRADIKHILNHLGLLKRVESDQTLLWITEAADQHGFYSGEDVSALVKDQGIDSELAKQMIAHNFCLLARESLALCGHLTLPGISKKHLKDRLLDHYVFNQKLNSFKFDNALGFLSQCNILDVDVMVHVKYATPAITLHIMLETYLHLASYNIGRLVNAKDLLTAIDSVIPNRSEDFSAMGYETHPLDGWGKRQATLTVDSVIRALELRVLSPVSIARVLRQLAKQADQKSMVTGALSQLRAALHEDMKAFRENPPQNLSEVDNEFAT